ncbi:MAG: hypothetical protein COA42_19050 [Alteromonadaceae bacterium]|nr:MAG: hypothetical protein COA42_19050 [Alteromonadaceae bacterium]
MINKLFLATLTLASTSAFSATEYKVKIDNVTTGAYFTPFLVAAHSDSVSLFDTGAAASANLQAMAEGGNISGLLNDVQSTGGRVVANPAGGLLAPGASAVANLGALNPELTEISIVAMLLPSNDGFVGLNSLTLPTENGTYTYSLNVYDAGTEANDEIRGSGAPGVAGMPVPPPLQPLLGFNGSGVPNITAEGFVSVHRGVLGDLDLNGGVSDIDAANQRWLNPTVNVTITVSGTPNN